MASLPGRFRGLDAAAASVDVVDGARPGLEVVLGQFFLAVLIARQVGMFLAGRREPGGIDDPQ